MPPFLPRDTAASLQPVEPPFNPNPSRCRLSLRWCDRFPLDSRHHQTSAVESRSAAVGLKRGLCDFAICNLTVCASGFLFMRWPVVHAMEPIQICDSGQNCTGKPSEIVASSCSLWSWWQWSKVVEWPSGGTFDFKIYGLCIQFIGLMEICLLIHSLCGSLLPTIRVYQDLIRPNNARKG
jgi:hypothetical protein